MLKKVFSKKVDLDKNVVKAFGMHNPQILNIVMKDGISQGKRFITSVSLLTDMDINMFDAQLCSEYINLYIKVVQMIMDKRSDKEIVDSILSMNKHIKSTNAYELFALCTITMVEPSFQLDEFNINKLHDYANKLKNSYPELKMDKERNESKLGLEMSYPLQITLDKIDTYLANLISDDFQILNWKREGSIVVKGISDPVDFYNSYLSNGKEYLILYVTMYGKNDDSSYIPLGFRDKHELLVNKKTTDEDKHLNDVDTSLRKAAYIDYNRIKTFIEKNRVHMLNDSDKYRAKFEKNRLKIENSILILDSSINQAFSEAMQNIQLLINGFSIDKSSIISKLKYAAENNHILAQFEYAKILMDGTLCDKNTDEALYWLNISAENGCIDSQIMLAYFYYDENEPLLYPKLSETWFHVASVNGNADALFHRGISMVHNQNNVSKANLHAIGYGLIFQAACLGSEKALKELDRIGINFEP